MNAFPIFDALVKFADEQAQGDGRLAQDIRVRREISRNARAGDPKPSRFDVADLNAALRRQGRVA